MSDARSRGLARLLEVMGQDAGNEPASLAKVKDDEEEAPPPLPPTGAGREGGRLPQLPLPQHPGRLLRASAKKAPNGAPWLSSSMPRGSAAGSQASAAPEAPHRRKHVRGGKRWRKAAKALQHAAGGGPGHGRRRKRSRSSSTSSSSSTSRAPRRGRRRSASSSKRRRAPDTAAARIGNPVAPSGARLTSVRPARPVAVAPAPAQQRGTRAVLPTALGPRKRLPAPRPPALSSLAAPVEVDAFDVDAADGGTPLPGYDDVDYA